MLRFSALVRARFLPLMGCLGLLSGKALALNLSDVPLYTTATEKPDVLLILDDSGSMSDPPYSGAPDSKWNIARNVASTLANTYANGSVNMGLMSYRTYDSSWNSYGWGLLQIPVNGNTANAITTRLAAMSNPNWTPIEGTLLTARNYFQGTSLPADQGGPTVPPPESCNRNYSILVTDGMPTQRPDSSPGSGSAATLSAGAIAAAASLYSDAGVPLYVVGFGNLSSASDIATLNGLANAGNTGTAYNSTDQTTLLNALNNIFANILSHGGSVSSAAANSQSVTTSTHIYQTFFNNKMADGVTEHWTGKITSLPLDPEDSNNDGSLVGSTDACIGSTTSGTCTALAAYNTRYIFTNRGNTGIRFLWPSDPATPTSTELSVAQSTALTSSAVLNYLRGDSSQEVRNGGTLRNRPYGVFGDVINSTPAYVGAPNSGYADSIEPSSAYSTFVSNNQSRQPMLYVGANDGMLHALSVNDGSSTAADKGKLVAEKWAYVPGALFSKLKLLSNTTYGHTFYVDGPPTVADAFISSAWKTVLVGGLNYGGKSVYALDITSPVASSESDAASKLLWEFTDADLGYTYSQPVIGKLQTGQWAAIFGSGFKTTQASGSVDAKLYIVNLETGALIAKLSTGVTAQNGTGDGTQAAPNGMATINAVDVDGDYKVDYVYGGDLKGNLWKFDLTSSNTAQWKVAYGSTAVPEPLYTAKDPGGSLTQVITTRPAVIAHPTQASGYMVFFGTGKYVEPGDTSNTSQQTQTFYGIWDNGSAIGSGRTNLQQQNILYQFSSNSNIWRQLSNNTVDWSTKQGWYLDLYDLEAASGTAPATNNTGERVVSNPVYRGGRVLFNTLSPSPTTCGAGGYTFTMVLDPATGGALPYSAFDVNRDKTFTSADFRTSAGATGTGAKPVSGMKLGNGIAGTPLILNLDRQRQISISTKSDGNIASGYLNAGTNVGRIAWREVFRQ